MAPDTSSFDDVMCPPEGLGNSVFAHLEMLAPDAGLEQLPLEFAQDVFPGKVALGAGMYRSDEGTPWTLPVVQKVLPLPQHLFPEIADRGGR